MSARKRDRGRKNTNPAELILFQVQVTDILSIFSDFDGLLRLQNIYTSIPKNELGVHQFQVEMVKKISSAKEAIDFLLELELINRNSLKRVVLDCPPHIAKV